jgi:hypothetical protein
VASRSSRPRFGALGDIHGDFEAMRRIMRRHPEVPFWLCVGDVADDEGRYEDPPAPLHFIKGNNENFDVLAAVTGEAEAPPHVGPFVHLHYIPNGVLTEIQGLRVVGLGGTLAPTWYHTPAADLPYPGQRRSGTSTAGHHPAGRATSGGRAPRMAKDDRRRHFVREEVEACKALRRIDVFLSHEAPRPYIVRRDGTRGNDAGKTPINELLAAMQPRLHLFGHHHSFTEQVRQGIRSVGLDLASRSYLLVDPETLEYERLES